MNHVIEISQLLKLGWALLAVATVFGVLWLRDLFLKLDLESAIRAIAKDPMASAVYLGLTFAGACYLVGQLLS